MGIVNRRNALIGWLVLKAGKRAARKKAQGAVPRARKGGAIAGAVAAITGLFVLKRKKRSDTAE